MVIEDFIKISYLSLLNSFSRQRLPRIPEPEMATTNLEAVQDYDRAIDSPLTILYALNLSVLKLLLGSKTNNLKCIDLGCGPGILTYWMADYLRLSSVVGVDLSSPMLEVARKRFDTFKQASQINLHYGFKCLDVSDLSSFDDGSFDVVTSMDTVHHLPTHELAQKTLQEAERVCSANGVVFISDLVRPKNNLIFKFYYKWIAKRNDKLNLKAHNIDFFNSLRAAWTCKEFSALIPKDSKKTWYLISPKGFEYVQVLIGVPKDSNAFSLKELELESATKFIPKHLKQLWKPTALSFKYGCKIEKIN